MYEKTTQVFNTSGNQETPNFQGGDSLKISTLAQQLSASASRAKARVGQTFACHADKLYVYMLIFNVIERYTAP